MNYPNKVHLFAHTIDVNVTPELITQEYTDSTGATKVRYGAAYFDPLVNEIRLYHNPNQPSIGQTNFFHEVIEATDCFCDMKLNHTQITTLASAMSQVWDSMYREAA